MADLLATLLELDPGRVPRRISGHSVVDALCACAGKTGQSAASDPDEPLPVSSGAARSRAAIVDSSRAAARPPPAPDPIPPSEQIPGSLDRTAWISPARGGASRSSTKIVARIGGNVQRVAMLLSRFGIAQRWIDSGAAAVNDDIIIW